MLEPKHRVAILLEASVVAAIGVDFNCPTNAPNITLSLVGNYDPRCQHPRFSQSFSSPADAEKHFIEGLAVSRDRGWTVAYLGVRNHG